MRKLNTISCDELMNTPLKPIEYFVENLITQGLFILAGAPKIGKSWLSLDLCLSVANGEPVLSRKTVQGTALYLCLEDSEVRIQSRLYEITDEPTDNLHFALLADSINGGLEQQLEKFISDYPDTKIIIIDTLQKIREETDMSYAADYKELSVLKTLADKHAVAIILVHHLRKTHDADPFNMISGTTGLSGCVDGSFVLAESKRGSRSATLYCVGRDIENREIELNFDKEKHRWVAEEEIKEEKDNNEIFIKIICDFVFEVDSFCGNATELVNLISSRTDKEMFPNRITRDLVQNAYILKERGVAFGVKRSGGVRQIFLSRCAGSDGKI